MVLVFRGLFIVVGLGFGHCVFVGCFSCLVWGFVAILFSFGLDLCFRFLCLLVVCGCVCLSL